MTSRYSQCLNYYDSNKDTFWSILCDTNYNVKEEIKEYGFGFSKNIAPYIIIPIISILLNLSAIFTFIKKHWYKKGSDIDDDSASNTPELNKKLTSVTKETPSEYKISSLELSLFFLTILELFMAVFWLSGSFIFQQAKDLQDKCITCFFFSILTIFFQTLDWCNFACILHNLKTILEFPLEERNFKKRLKFYVLNSFIVSGGYTLMVILTNLYGVSPMLTCFIRNNNFSEDRLIGLIITLIIPIFYIIFCIYLFIYIFRIKSIREIREVKTSTIKLLFLAFLYILFYFPTMILLLITIGKEIERGTFLSWLSYYCSLSNMSVNLVVSFARIMDDYLSFPKFWNMFFTKEENENYYNSLNQSELEENSEIIEEKSKTMLDLERKTSDQLVKHNSGNLAKRKSYNSIIDFSANLLELYIRDVFLGISVCLIKSKNDVELIDNIIMNKYISENREIKFDSNKEENTEILNQLNSCFDLTNKSVFVKVIDHSPKIFKKLRFIEKISEEEIVKSLLKVNPTSLSGSKGGASSALFIPTEDNLYLIKTMEDLDYQTIMDKSFMTYYLMYFSYNPNSLICRYYGLFSIFCDQSSVPLKVVVMRHARSNLKSIIRGTYDLKGSTMNRKVIIPKESKGTSKEYLTVKKDLNFKEEIGSLNLNDRDKERFLKYVTMDSQFLLDKGIMDYSLFIFKLEYTENEKTLLLKNDTFVKFYSRHYFEANVTNKSDDFSNENVRNSINSENSLQTGYFIMIIDYLQVYNLNKQLETGFKGIFASGQSSVPPDTYSERFINYCNSIA